MGGKSKANGAHKTSSGVSKKNHLRQHLRRIIKKCLKRPNCFMDIQAFESWKRLGYGDINDLGKFSKTVEVHDDGTVNILEYFSTGEISNILTRIHVKGPVHTQKLKKKEPEKFQNRQQKRPPKNKGNKGPVAVTAKNTGEKPANAVPKKKNFKKQPKPAAEKKEN